MPKSEECLVPDLLQLRRTGLKPGDQVEFGVKGGCGELGRFMTYAGEFQKEIWRAFSVHDHRSWWDRLVRRPVRITLNGEEFEPFEFFDAMRARGMEVAIISAIQVSVHGEVYRIPWKRLRFLRKVS